MVFALGNLQYHLFHDQSTLLLLFIIVIIKFCFIFSMNLKKNQKPKQKETFTSPIRPMTITLEPPPIPNSFASCSAFGGAGNRFETLGNAFKPTLNLIMNRLIFNHHQKRFFSRSNYRSQLRERLKLFEQLRPVQLDSKNTIVVTLNGKLYEQPRFSSLVTMHESECDFSFLCSFKQLTNNHAF